MSLSDDLMQLPPRLRGVVMLGLASGLSRREVVEAILAANPPYSDDDESEEPSHQTTDDNPGILPAPIR